MIYVGDVCPYLDFAFDKVEKPEVVMYRERGQPIASWTVTICRGFRGFPIKHAAERLAH